MTLYVSKLANEAKDFTIDWTTRGLGTDTINSASFSVQPNGLGINSSAPSKTSTTSTFWASGGERNNSYVVTASVVTAGGRILQETIIVFVEP